MGDHNNTLELLKKRLKNIMKLLASLLSQSSFVILNKALIKTLGLNEALVLSFLCDRSRYYDTQDFYYTIEDLANDTGLTQRAVRDCMKSLIKNDIVLKKTFGGLPPKQYYNINFDKLATYITNETKSDHKDTQQNIITTKDNNIKNVMDNPIKIERDIPIKNDRVNTVKIDRDIYNNNKVNNNKEINNKNKKEKYKKEKSEAIKSYDDDLVMRLKEKNISEDTIKKICKLNFPEEVKKSDHFNALLDFVIHRLDIKAPLTQRGLELCIKKLSSFNNPIKAIENSIMNGYRGLFENNKYTNDNTHTKQDQDEVDSEQIKNILNNIDFRE